MRKWILKLGVGGLGLALWSGAPALAHEPETGRALETGERLEEPCEHAGEAVGYPVGVHAHTPGHRVYHARGRYVSRYGSATAPEPSWSRWLPPVWVDARGR